jgi:hypothetical protein
VNPQDPLAALHPLRDPAAIGWWPLAPGWWLLIAVAILAIGILCYYLVRRYRANAYRRLALAQLQQIQAHCHDGMEDEGHLQKIAGETNSLLKAVALRAFSREDIASLSGEAWLEFLNTTQSGKANKSEFPAGFANAAYVAGAPELDNEALFRAAKAWISNHRTPA